MYKPTFAGTLVLLLLAACAANAQQPYVNIEQRLSAGQLHEAGLDRLTSAQLQALNRLLREESAAGPIESVAAPSTAPDPAAAVAVVGTPAAPAAVVAVPPVADHDVSRNLIGLSDTVIKSRLNGTVAGWEPGTVFALANGQQWKVLKGSVKLRTPRQSPEVLVVPGIAGRWFLQVDEDYPKARVYRIN